MNVQFSNGGLQDSVNDKLEHKVLWDSRYI